MGDSGYSPYTYSSLFAAAVSFWIACVKNRWLLEDLPVVRSVKSRQPVALPAANKGEPMTDNKHRTKSCAFV
jgi:hypothetical protein